LRHGVVDLPAGFPFHTLLVDVVHDPDHAYVSVVATGQKLAYRISIRPVGARHRFIDQHHVFARRSVVPGKVAAAQSRAHGSNKSRRGDVDQRARCVLEVFAVSSFGSGSTPGAILPEWQIIRHAGRFDAGYGLNTGEDLLEDVPAFLGAECAGLVVGDIGVIIHFYGGRAVGLEAQFNIEDLHEAAQQEPCSDQQDAGERDLGDDEDGAEALVLAALAGASAGVFENLQQVTAGDAQSGDQAEEDGREDCDKDSPAQSPSVDAERAQQGQCDRALVGKPHDDRPCKAQT
jgi:hypothetical protein